MNRASPAMLRKAVEMTNAMIQSGILFVPMPVADADEFYRRASECDARLEQMAQAAEQEEVRGQ